MSKIIGIIYLVIGVIVASNKGYIGDVGSIGDVINLILAIVLWPLVLIGVDFNIKIGGGDKKKKGSLLFILPALYAQAKLQTIWDAEVRPNSRRNGVLESARR